jgi:hypothetical protein
MVFESAEVGCGTETDVMANAARINRFIGALGSFDAHGTAVDSMLPKFSTNHQPVFDRTLPRKTFVYKMTCKHIIEQATKLGADGEGLDGYEGWVRSCLKRDPISVLRILMTKRNKVTAITAINNISDEWKLAAVEKLQSQGLLTEGTVSDAEETE